MVFKSSINAGGGGGNNPNALMGTLYIGTPQDQTIVAVSYAEYPFSIDALNNLKTSSGTITLDVKINGVNITGLTGLAVNSVAQNPPATALNNVVAGDRVTFVLSANAGSADLEFTMKGTKT